MAKGNLHRGELLKKIVDASGMNKTILIKKTGYKSTTSYYNHIEDKNLSAEILLKYGEALNYDFSSELPDVKRIKAMLSNEEPATLNEAQKQIAYWKAKYYEILEKYNQILERQLKK
ncbi:hypothetical protein GCM10027051_33800 [Niabella terrae]